MRLFYTLKINKIIQKHKPLIHGHFFYRFILQTANIMFLPFYLISLYKRVWKFRTNFFREGCVPSRLVRVIAMPFVIEKVGYRAEFKVSFAIQATSFLLIFIFFDNIRAFYIFLGLIIGIGRGTHWAISNLVDQKELKSRERGKIFNLLTSINLPQSIILPMLSGALITQLGEFRYIAFILFAIHLLAVFSSWSSKIAPRSHIQSAEITKN